MFLHTADGVPSSVRVCVCVLPPRLLRVWALPRLLRVFVLATSEDPFRTIRSISQVFKTPVQ